MAEFSKRERKLVLENPFRTKKEKGIQVTAKTSRSVERNSVKKHLFNDDFLLSSFCRSIMKKNEEKEMNNCLKTKISFKLSRNIKSMNRENKYTNDYLLFQNATQRKKILFKKLILHEFCMKKDNEKHELINLLKRKEENYKKDLLLTSHKNMNKFFDIKNNKLINKFLIKSSMNKKNNTIIFNNNRINNNSSEKQNNSSLSNNSQNYFKHRMVNILFNKKLENLKNKIHFSNNSLSNMKEHINKVHKKIMNINIISKSGKENNKNNVNKDTYFILPQINNCKDIKIFGIFSGYGNNGSVLSREIKEYFQNYFVDLLNDNNNSKKERNLDNNIFNEGINRKKQIINNFYLLRTGIYKINNNNVNYSEEKKKQKLSRKLKDKSDEVKKLYNKLISDSYSEIFSAYKKLDEKLHVKYFDSNTYHLSGSTSSLLFLFNLKNCNKIITSNLGDSKIILISKNYKIKELNTIHTLKNFTEKKRIIGQDGLISQLPNGPLRIWIKNKIYPDISITRCFGYFKYKYLGVISVPDVKEYDLDNEEIKILIFGSNGFWKLLSNENIMNIVLPYYEENDIEGATKDLIETATNINKLKNPIFVADITISIIFFK